jgi:phosphohistidine phosphatase
MRRLIVFRHAKAERSFPGASDIDRALAPEGRADAAVMGAYMARHDVRPDRVLVSPAVRTRQTWDVVRPAFAAAPPVDVVDRIYDATPQALSAVIAEAPDSARALMLVGHNPGLQELAAMLVATGDIETRERLRESLPTSGLAVIDFAFERWSDLHPHSGRLERFVSPKTIAAATN